jgi:hypothetical protein
MTYSSYSDSHPRGLVYAESLDYLIVAEHVG